MKSINYKIFPTCIAIKRNDPLFEIYKCYSELRWVVYVNVHSPITRSTVCDIRLLCRNI